MPIRLLNLNAKAAKMAEGKITGVAKMAITNMAITVTTTVTIEVTTETTETAIAIRLGITLETTIGTTVLTAEAIIITLRGINPKIIKIRTNLMTNGPKNKTLQTNN